MEIIFIALSLVGLSVYIITWGCRYRKIKKHMETIDNKVTMLYSMEKHLNARYMAIFNETDVKIDRLEEEIKGKAAAKVKNPSKKIRKE